VITWLKKAVMQEKRSKYEGKGYNSNTLRRGIAVTIRGRVSKNYKDSGGIFRQKKVVSGYGKSRGKKFQFLGGGGREETARSDGTI